MTSVTVDFSCLAGPCYTVEQWLHRHIPKPEPLLGELFTTTSRSLFVADTGAGKTMLMVAFAFAMSLGVDFLHWRGRRRARVLFIDGEMSRFELCSRLRLACKWFGRPGDELTILSREDFEDMPPIDTQEGQDWLDAKIDELGPLDFIIFDNLMSLSQGIMKEEESWLSIKGFVLSLTRRNIGQLWVHHTGHDKTRSYGTKTREWQMDTAIVGENVGTDHLAMTLTFTKKRRRGPGNFNDFEDVFIELIDDGKNWSSGEIRRKSSGGRPNVTDDIAIRALSIAWNGASTEAWRAKAIELGISKGKTTSAQNQAFHRARNSLIEAGRVSENNEVT